MSRVGHPRTQLQQNQKTTRHVPNSHAGEGDVVASNRSLIDGQIRASNHVIDLESYRSPHSTHLTPNLSTSGGPNKSSNLSPAFSGAHVVDETPSVSNNQYIVVTDQQLPLKRRRIGGHSLGARDESNEVVLERDMEQLFEMHVLSPL
jgi:hypothetical protein